jgi:dipeptidyl aminopeptidase/acylaminoacyl peptidase
VSELDLAERITGRLLLVHGGLDDNVQPHHTLRMVERLIAADKDFDLLVVPRGEHVLLGYEHHMSGGGGTTCCAMWQESLR